MDFVLFSSTGKDSTPRGTDSLSNKSDSLFYFLYFCCKFRFIALLLGDEPVISTTVCSDYFKIASHLFARNLLYGILKSSFFCWFTKSLILESVKRLHDNVVCYNSENAQPSFVVVYLVPILPSP